MIGIKRYLLVLGVTAILTGCGHDSNDEQTGGCPEGMHKMGNNCVQNVLGCPTGQHKEGNSCVPDTVNCPTGQHKEGNSCVPDTINCPTGQHKEGNSCVPDTVNCPTGQHQQGNECVPDTINCPTGQHQQGNDCVPDIINCPTGQHQQGNDCVPDVEGELRCDSALCAQKNGTCNQGVCVTSQMLAIEDGDTCDSQNFEPFCKGKIPVYCDHGMVPLSGGECEEGCVVYRETYWGEPKWQSGCIDGGSCRGLNQIKRECVLIDGIPTVMVKACQQTVENGLQWVSVNGYGCQAGCDTTLGKCAQTEEECDPYDHGNYSCDNQTLRTCYINSSGIAVKRSDYCDDKCVIHGNIPMCGYSCTQEGQREHRCVHADSMSYFDSGDFICKKVDSGELYSIWTKDYVVCATPETCEASTGECQ